MHLPRRFSVSEVHACGMTIFFYPHYLLELGNILLKFFRILKTHMQKAPTFLAVS